MTVSYCYLKLKGPGRDSMELRRRLESRILGEWRRSGISIWGIWEGLFGVASNELLVVVAAEDGQTTGAFTGVLDAEGDQIRVVESLMLNATVRPLGNAPCDRPGLYVFRFFDVANADVEEIARLSAAAWETFEHTPDYQAEPQGLFCEQDRSRTLGRMLLVTWYDGLESWQTSRRPAPEAMDNFMRRRELTLGTVAIATRLVEPFADRDG